MPSDITIKDILILENHKGVSITRNDTNVTVMLLVAPDANISTIVTSLTNLREPWFNFYKVYPE